MFRRAVVFTPMASMDAAGGPMKVMPAASTARASSAFSERNPYPGWIASAPVFFAASITFSMAR
jgi:hypothetical protein